ncbi:MAG: alpha/beta hydrolase [Pseudomonadota bacterium]
MQTTAKHRFYLHHAWARSARARRPTLALAALTLLVSAVAGAPVQNTHAQAGLGNVDITFLTVRDRTGSDNPTRFFGDGRGTLSAGVCKVRSLDFGGFQSLATSVPAYVQKEFLRIDGLEELAPADVIDRDGAQNSTGPRAIYVHGYNMDFAKGCRRAAILQSNANLEDRLLWFSWPSDGIVSNYTRDEADMFWSAPDLADIILSVDTQDGPGVDVVGHSLGARGVVLALYEVVNRRPDAQLGNVVLIAPDMDFEIFGRLLPRILPITASLTVYVAAGDLPLALSQQVHGYPRLGQASNDFSRLHGVEVIDLSELDIEDPTGHLYHIYSPEFGADLNRLLNEDAHAGDREDLRQIGPNRWLMEPGAQ